MFRAPRMANASCVSLHQLQNGFPVCTNVQRVCCPLRVFFPFVRRTAVQISVCEELQDVRCGIAFFCVHTSMHSSVQGNRRIGQPWPINLLFCIDCARDTSWFSWNVEEMPDVSFLKLFESLSNTELAELACAVIVVRKFKHISPRMSIALWSPSH